MEERQAERERLRFSERPREPRQTPGENFCERVLGPRGERGGGAERGGGSVEGGSYGSGSLWLSGYAYSVKTTPIK